MSKSFFAPLVLLFAFFASIAISPTRKEMKLDLKYTGPIIPGWPPDRSRNVADYILPGRSTLLSDVSLLNDFSEAKILIMVQSSPANLERRNTNRQTWMKNSPMEVKTIFIFGTDEKVSSIAIANELQEFGDVLQMNFVDSYYNGTLDSLSALKFFLEFGSTSIAFLCIADDDVYLNLKAVRRLLLLDGVINANSDFLLGDLHFRPRLPKVKKSHLKDAFTTKFETPNYMRRIDGGKKPPKYLNGGFYAIPSTRVRRLFESALSLPLLVWNDVFITGFAAEKCGLRRKNHSGWHRFGLTDLDNVNWNSTYSVHHVDNEKKLEIYRKCTSR